MTANTTALTVTSIRDLTALTGTVVANGSCRRHCSRGCRHSCRHNCRRNCRRSS